MDAQFNVLAVLVASGAAMLLGGLWYSPLLFESRWRRLVSKREDQETSNPAIVYGGAFLLILLGAAVFHAFLGPDPELGFALGAGLGAGIAWAAGSIWISYLFEGRAGGLYLINGGYHTAQYILFGLIFGLL
ncbi:MAG: DUF1761 domain-containing protein [Pseudomonadota bacterium]